MDLSPEEAEFLLADLCREPRETPWLEFKENKAEPHEIGEYVSALANAAVLAGRGRAYMVWGVRDADHQIVGTRFAPETLKVGNEDFIPWLTRGLEPQVTLAFTKAEVGDARVLLLEIAAARERPVAFYGAEFIRIGSYKSDSGTTPTRSADCGEPSSERCSKPASLAIACAKRICFSFLTTRRTSSCSRSRFRSLARGSWSSCRRTS